MISTTILETLFSPIEDAIRYAYPPMGALLLQDSQPLELFSSSINPIEGIELYTGATTNFSHLGGRFSLVKPIIVIPMAVLLQGAYSLNKEEIAFFIQKEQFSLQMEDSLIDLLLKVAAYVCIILALSTYYPLVSAATILLTYLLVSCTIQSFIDQKAEEKTIRIQPDVQITEAKNKLKELSNKIFKTLLPPG